MVVRRIVSLVLVGACGAGAAAPELGHFDHQVGRNAERMVAEGRHTFRFDTFGDEAFWGDTLKLHLAIEGARFGGVGPGIGPRAALGLGLKVDADALRKFGLLRELNSARVDLDDPAVSGRTRWWASPDYSSASGSRRRRSGIWWSI